MQSPNKKKREEVVLVCANAYDPWVTEGTVFGANCYRCNAELMVARTGQLLLAKNPEAKTVCYQCFVAHHRGEPLAIAADHASLASEIATRKPNMWRHRN
jgi:hypothetical protein